MALAAEDGKFLDHDGLDWEGIQKVLEKNVKKGRIAAGGSTVSQQPARNLFLSGQRPWWRKAQEEAAITPMATPLIARKMETIRARMPSARCHELQALAK